MAIAKIQGTVVYKLIIFVIDNSLLIRRTE